MTLEVSGITKRFGDFPALYDLNLKGEPGEFLALLGPSGSGKTTLLRILAGLEFPDSGSVLFGGEDLSAKPARERQIGMVFQHYALFRHMTVAENIAFGLTVRPGATRPRRAVIKARVDELLQLVQLEGLGNRFPNQLSGGQRQRVALARALAIEPRMLLLDEPFGALDAKVRKELRRWLRHIHDQTDVTTLFVTHDQEEALDLADRVVLLNKGRIEQIGRPEEVYANPASAFVYEFLGNTNRFDGEVRGGRFVIDGCAVPFEGDPGRNGAAVAFARPHDLALAGPGEDGFLVEINGIFRAAPQVTLETRRIAGGGFVEIELPRGAESAHLKPGDHVKVLPKRLRVFPG
jgi:sulfate transport system ATP-binding protein